MAFLRFFQGFQLVLCVLGAYLTWYVALRNGTAAEFENLRHLHSLSGTDTPLRQTFTGISPIDKRLGFLNSIIWLVTNDKTPGVLLHAYLYVGQFAAAYGLLIIEGARHGNVGKPTSQ